MENDTQGQKVARLIAFMAANEVTKVAVVGCLEIRDFIKEDGIRLFGTLPVEDEHEISFELYHRTMIQISCGKWEAALYPLWVGGVRSIKDRPPKREVWAGCKNYVRLRWEHPDGSVYDVEAAQKEMETQTLDFVHTFVRIDDYGPFKVPVDGWRGLYFNGLRPVVGVGPGGDKCAHYLSETPYTWNEHLLQIFRQFKLLGFKRSECGVSSDHSIIGWYVGNRSKFIMDEVIL